MVFYGCLPVRREEYTLPTESSHLADRTEVGAFEGARKLDFGE